MRKQKGITLIGMLLTAAVIIILGILVMRVVPVYVQNYEIKSSIKALGNLDKLEVSDDAGASAEALKNKLMNQLYINGINEIQPKHVSVTPAAQDNHFLVTVKYKVIKPLIANISLLFEFNETQEVSVESH